jgi:hypothetical protein
VHYIHATRHNSYNIVLHNVLWDCDLMQLITSEALLSLIQTQQLSINCWYWPAVLSHQVMHSCAGNTITNTQKPFQTPNLSVQGKKCGWQEHYSKKASSEMHCRGGSLYIINIIITYYILKVSFPSVAVFLTLVQTWQMRINISKKNKTQ